MNWRDVRVGDVINFTDGREDGWGYTCLVIYPTAVVNIRGKCFQVVRINSNKRSHIIYKEYFEALITKLLARVE